MTVLQDFDTRGTVICVQGEEQSGKQTPRCLGCCLSVSVCSLGQRELDQFNLEEIWDSDGVKQ